MSDALNDRIEELEAAIAELGPWTMLNPIIANILIARDRAILDVLYRRRGDNPSRHSAEPIKLQIRDGNTAQRTMMIATAVVKIGSAASSHVIVPRAEPVHVTLHRAADGTVWGMNIHPRGEGVAYSTPAASGDLQHTVPLPSGSWIRIDRTLITIDG
jgi:hypothetical protein